MAESTKDNLVSMNNDFLEMVDHGLQLSYSCNTILVDDHGFLLFENCLIVYLLRRIRESAQRFLQQGKAELD